jgi:uncharacterized protein involved in outer membrane biogenesis
MVENGVFMTKKGKRIIRIAAAGILLIVLVFWASSRRIMKAAIESAATRALGVAVTVGRVDLSILTGKVAIQKLNVQNPLGYEIPHLLQLGRVVVKLRPMSLLSETVQVNQIILEDTTLTIEQKGLSNNLSEVMKSIKRDRAAAGGEQARPAEEKGKKLRIEQVKIKNTKVRVKLLALPGQADVVELKLAPIRISGLSSEGRMDAAAVATKVLVALAQGVAEQGVGVLPSEVISPIKSQLTAIQQVVSEQAKKLLQGAEEAGQAGKGMIETGTDVGKKVGETIEKLLAPAKDKKQ